MYTVISLHWFSGEAIWGPRETSSYSETFGAVTTQGGEEGITRHTKKYRTALSDQEGSTKRPRRPRKPAPGSTSAPPPEPPTPRTPGRCQDKPVLWDQLGRLPALGEATLNPCLGPSPRHSLSLCRRLRGLRGNQGPPHPGPPHTVALCLRWEARSTGNKAAGRTTPLYLPQIWPQPAARGKAHCERTLNYGCGFSWRLSFWQEV